MKLYKNKGKMEELKIFLKFVAIATYFFGKIK